MSLSKLFELYQVNISRRRGIRKGDGLPWSTEVLSHVIEKHLEEIEHRADLLPIEIIMQKIESCEPFHFKNPSL